MRFILSLRWVYFNYVMYTIAYLFCSNFSSLHFTVLLLYMDFRLWRWHIEFVTFKLFLLWHTRMDTLHFSLNWKQNYTWMLKTMTTICSIIRNKKILYLFCVSCIVVESILYKLSAVTQYFCIWTKHAATMSNKWSLFC